MYFLTNENPYGRSLSLRRDTYVYIFRNKLETVIKVLFMVCICFSFYSNHVYGFGDVIFYHRSYIFVPCIILCFAVFIAF